MSESIAFEAVEKRRNSNNELVDTVVIKIETRLVKDGVVISNERDATEEEKKFYLSKKGK